jgi:protein phosphatase
VFRAAESSDDYGGMGTTIVGLIVNGAQAAIGSVGDSRVYRLSGGRLLQVTTDDSWASTILAQDPTMKPEDIAQHPMRNVLTNVLGGRASVDVRISEHTLRAGDVLLLCSDGLHGVMDVDSIKTVIENTPDVDGAARTLVETALDRGSRDNVTALVVRYEGSA